MGACISCNAPNTPVRQSVLENGVVVRLRRCHSCDREVEAWLEQVRRERAARQAAIASRTPVEPVSASRRATVGPSGRTASLDELAALVGLT
jgi:hypothetical protein